MELKGKQARFAEEYLIDLNATQAAIRAGYSKKTAEQYGYQLLQKTSVAAAIAEAQAKRRERLVVTVDSISEAYDEDRKLAHSAKQASAAVSATTGKAKLHGLLRENPAVEIGPINITICFV